MNACLGRNLSRPFLKPFSLSRYECLRQVDVRLIHMPVRSSEKRALEDVSRGDHAVPGWPDLAAGSRQGPGEIAVLKQNLDLTPMYPAHIVGCGGDILHDLRPTIDDRNDVFEVVAREDVTTPHASETLPAWSR